MLDNELLLMDRISAIQAMNVKYNLLDNAYISFSGGKDSTVLHYLIDLALPNNKIPRVYVNTGIEYNDIIGFVKELSKSDERIKIINTGKNIKQILNQYGYPFKSKQHSHNLSVYQHNGLTITNKKYLGLAGKTNFLCPNKLKYQFTTDFKIPVSDKCCYKLKKEPFHLWQKQNNKTIAITGMRAEEGGYRNNLNCIEANGTKFHPLVKIDSDFENWFIDKYNIKLCKLYYPPFNFERTGCKGCPFSLDLQEQLEVMKELLPQEYKQCEFLWKPVYDEYRRIGYRLKSNDNQLSFNLFDGK